jgi:zinc protease
MTAGAIDRSQRPASGPAPAIRLPRINRFELKSGLKVLAVQHDDIPEVSTRIVLPYGSVQDDGGKAGTALMTARALTEGTVERSAGDVAEWLDYLGARLKLDVKYDGTQLSFRSLSRVFDEALELLAEIVTRPAFVPAEVDRLRDERLDEIASGRDEPRVVANLRLNEASFDEHPYGMRTGGVEETVRNIDPATLSDFHSRFYRPDGATMIIVGDLPEPDELEARLESTFGGWEGRAVEPRTLDQPQGAEARRIRAVPWPGPQSEIRVGFVGIDRHDPDFFAAILMNSILGGLFSSRINMNLREDKGWTYGASSRVDARKYRGHVYAATAVESGVTVDAVREILAEMDRMKTHPPAADELKLAQNSLTLSLPRLFETPGQVSGRLATQILYRLPDDYWENYADSVRAVSVADVQRAAERLLPTDCAAIVVVGPAADFMADLEALGSVEIRDKNGRPAEL